MSSNSEKKTPSINYNYLISGTIAGAAATGIFHPLELIKVRYQVNEISKPKLLNYDIINKIRGEKAVKSIISNGNLSSSASPNSTNIYRPAYRNMFDTVIRIYKEEHGIRGLYRGLSINIVASGMAWGFYFLIYNTLKQNNKTIQENLSNNQSNSKLSSVLANYTLDATMAGIVTILITNPFFLIKTRMCLQYAYQANANIKTVNTIKYKNSIDVLKHLIQTDGFRGLYKGIIPGIFGTINGTIQMVAYDLMKQSWLKYLNLKQKQAYSNGSNNAHTHVQLNSSHYLIFSGLSKSLAVISTYPFQVIRSRIQDQHRNYKSLNEIITTTYKLEGFVGFYKGLIPCLLRVTPAACVTFLIYENLLKLLAAS